MSSHQTHRDRGQGGDVAGAEAQGVLDAWDGVALLIEPTTARVVAANAFGRALFPGVGDGRGVVLDGAMPAVRTLRKIAESGSVPGGIVPLVFWTARGSTAATGLVETFESPSGRSLLLVKTAIDARGIVASPDAARRQNREPDGDAAPMGAPGSAPLAVDRPAETGMLVDLAQLAHELKTPLSAIAAASEIMKEGRFGTIDNERYAGYIADIHHSARHALALIERLLGRRSEAEPVRGKALTFEKIALDDLVEGCVSSVRPLASDKGVALSLQAGRSPVIVTADATAVKQVVLNVVMNAVKFTPAGGSVTIATEPGERGAASVTVEDNGPGMSAVAIAEALRPVAVHATGVRDGGGLGIGLPLSRALAEAMGATFAIDSATGRGTRVTLSFPGGPLRAI